MLSGITFVTRPPRVTVNLAFVLLAESALNERALLFIALVALFTPAGLAFQAVTDGPKVLKTKVGGEGGTDYIFADTVGRRLAVTRGATQPRPATDTTPEVPPSKVDFRSCSLSRPA